MRLATVPDVKLQMAVAAYVPGANYTNAHSIDVAATPSVVWSVLPELPAKLLGSGWALPLKLPLLAAAAMRRDPLTGTSLRVASMVEGKEVVLQGRHRYADYAANIFLQPLGPRRTRVYNVSRAKFRRGGLGVIYLAGVHVFHDLYIRFILGRLKALAEGARQ